MTVKELSKKNKFKNVFFICRKLAQCKIRFPFISIVGFTITLRYFCYRQSF